MPIKFSNFGRSTLATSIVATTAAPFTMNVSTGARFAAYGEHEYEYLILKNALLQREIVKVTGRTGNALTVSARGLAGTTQLDWSIGDVVEAALTSEGLIALFDDPTVKNSLTLEGIAARLRADFSNNIQGNRASLQTNIVNGPTLVQAIPNGIGTVSHWAACNNSDANNTELIVMQIDMAGGYSSVTKRGSGVYKKYEIRTSDIARVTVLPSGETLIGAGASVWNELFGVQRSGNATLAGFYGSSVSYTDAAIRVQTETPPSRGWKLLELLSAGGNARCTVYGNGDIDTAGNVNVMGRLGVSGANYGGAGQALLSGGANASPVWTSLTKNMVGLDQADNTSDATKNAAQATLTNKTLVSPTFSGTATAANFNLALTGAIDIGGGTDIDIYSRDSIELESSYVAITSGGTMSLVARSLDVEAEVGMNFNTPAGSIKFRSSAGSMELECLHELGFVVGDELIAHANAHNLILDRAHGKGSFANDVAAAAGGVSVAGVYHTAGTLKIRLS